MVGDSIAQAGKACRVGGGKSCLGAPMIPSRTCWVWKVLNHRGHRGTQRKGAQGEEAHREAGQSPPPPSDFICALFVVLGGLRFAARGHGDHHVIALFIVHVFDA